MNLVDNFVRLETATIQLPILKRFAVVTNVNSIVHFILFEKDNHWCFLETAVTAFESANSQGTHLLKCTDLNLTFLFLLIFLGFKWSS